MSTASGEVENQPEQHRCHGRRTEPRKRLDSEKGAVGGNDQRGPAKIGDRCDQRRVARKVRSPCAIGSEDKECDQPGADGRDLTVMQPIGPDKKECSAIAQDRTQSREPARTPWGSARQGGQHDPADSRCGEGPRAEKSKAEAPAKGGG